MEVLAVAVPILCSGAAGQAAGKLSFATARFRASFGSAHDGLKDLGRLEKLFFRTATRALVRERFVHRVVPSVSGTGILPCRAKLNSFAGGDGPR